MCSVSMVGDHYNDIFRQKFPQVPIWPPPSQWTPPEITRAEFDELKRQVTEMKELLKRAKEYDERNNEPDCEIEEKMDLLRRIASMVGVDLDEALKPKTA